MIKLALFLLCYAADYKVSVGVLTMWFSNFTFGHSSFNKNHILQVAYAFLSQNKVEDFFNFFEI